MTSKELRALRDVTKNIEGVTDLFDIALQELAIKEQMNADLRETYETLVDQRNQAELERASIQASFRGVERERDNSQIALFESRRELFQHYGASDASLVTRIFGEPGYLAMVRAEKAHLVSLKLNWDNKSALEVGAGIGEHTSFLLDRNCVVTTSDGREDNTAILQRRWGHRTRVRKWDVENVQDYDASRYEILHVYGLLYHLKEPALAIKLLSRLCTNFMVLSTCVQSTDGESEFMLAEDPADLRNSVNGYGVRPSRQWVFNELLCHFPYAYYTTTQPNHTDYPLEFKTPKLGLTRAVFVASHTSLSNSSLSTLKPDVYERI